MKRKILISIDPETGEERKPGSDEPCPICGDRLGFPAISRFDNKTEICSYCGESEGTGFLFSGFNEVQRVVLRWIKLDAVSIGLSEWEAHCIVIAAINGSRRGMHSLIKESFEQLKEHGYGQTKPQPLERNQTNMDWFEGDLSD